MGIPPKLGVVVGLAAEARLAARIAGPELIATSGATAAGARAASDTLVARGATHLLSFGFAAGLDPSLPAGAVLLPGAVIVEREAIATDPALTALFGSGVGTALLHSDWLVAECVDKRALRDASGCAALDMESGAVAVAARRAGLPFAVLRAVCDPAGTALPPAAQIALRHDGAIDRMGVFRSILRHPAQVPALIGLGRNVRAAQIALRSCLQRAATMHGMGSGRPA